jgi:tetratricopeptide (TPR) repeat protein
VELKEEDLMKHAFLLSAMKRLFALAALAVAALSAQGRWTQKFDVFLKRVDSLTADYKAAYAAIDWKHGYNDAAPGYSASLRVHQELVAAFESASSEAGESADAWIELAKRVPEIGLDQDTRIRTAEKAVQLRSNAETLLWLGQALKSKHYWYALSKSEADRAGLERARTVLRSAVRLSASKNPLILYELGDCLKALYELDEAETQLQLAARLAPNNDKALKKNIAKALIMNAYLASNKQLMESRFSEFADSGLAESGDWGVEAQWLQNMKDYVRSGETFLKAAALFHDWSLTCQAAQSFHFGGETDRTLSSARDCIKQGEGKDRSEGMIAQARSEIASALNERGIFADALFEIKQALTGWPNDAFFLDIEATSLYGLSRYQDAIAASHQAIRASDGKYGFMHFHLGNSYFQLKDWKAAADSFERAAKLEPSDPAAAYNVAASLQNAGFKREAIQWYREVISRDPAYASKNEVPGSIADLEKRLQ